MSMSKIKKHGRQILSLVLAFALMFTMLPMDNLVYAKEEEPKALVVEDGNEMEETETEENIAIVNNVLEDNSETLDGVIQEKNTDSLIQETVNEAEHLVEPEETKLEAYGSYTRNFGEVYWDNETPGILCIELDADWVKNHTVLYGRLLKDGLKWTYAEFPTEATDSDYLYTTWKEDCRSDMDESASYQYEIWDDEGHIAFSENYNYIVPSEKLAKPIVKHENINTENERISWEDISGAYAYNITLLRDGLEVRRERCYNNTYEKTEAGSSLWKEIESDKDHKYSFIVQALSENIELKANSDYSQPTTEFVPSGGEAPSIHSELRGNWNTKKDKFSFSYSGNEDYKYSFEFYRNEKLVSNRYSENSMAEFDTTSMFVESGIYSCIVWVSDKNRNLILKTELASTEYVQPENHLPKPTGLHWDGKKPVWDPVEGADEYYVTLWRFGGVSEENKTTENSFEKENDYFWSYYEWESGAYTFTVTAVDTDGNMAPSISDMSEPYYKKASLLSFLSNQITLLKSGSSAREKISLNPIDSYTFVDIGLYDMDGQPISGDIVTVSGSNRIGGTGERIRVKGNVDVELIGKQITVAQDVVLKATMENGSPIEKNVRLIPAKEIPSLDQYDVGEEYAYIAVPNIDNTLTDVIKQNKALPEGWKWTNENQNIANYKGATIMYSETSYEDTDANESQKRKLPIYFCTLQEIKLKASDGEISSQLQVGDCVVLQTEEIWYPMSNQSLLAKREDIKNAQTSLQVTRGDSVSVEKTETGFQLNAVKKGTTVLSLVYKIGEKVVLKKDYTITVADQVADVQVQLMKGDTLISSEDGVYPIKVDTSSSLQEKYWLKNATDTSYKITYQSSDTSVLKVDKNGVLQPLKSGTVLLKATANDTFKTSKEFLVKVLDASSNNIILNTGSISLNQALKRPSTRVIVYDGIGRRVKAVALNSSIPDSGLEIKTVPDSNELEIYTDTPEKLKKGKISIAVTLEDELYTEVTKDFEISVGVINQVPDVSIVQEYPIELAYVEYGLFYDISSNTGIIKSVKMSLNGTQIYDSYEEINDNRYSAYARVKTKEITKNQQVKIQIDFDGYRPVEKYVNIKTQKSKYTLTNTTGTYYPALGNELKTKIWNATEKRQYYLDSEAEVEIGNANYYLRVGNDGGVIIRPKDYYVIPAKGETVKIILKKAEDGASFVEDIPLSFTIKSVSIDKTGLELGKNTITLYDNGQEAKASTTIRFKGDVSSPFHMEYVNIQENVNTKLGKSLDKTLAVYYDTYTGNIVVQKLSADLKPGTYKFKLSLALPQKVISTTLAVNVVNTDQNDVKINVKTNNSIDVLDRDNSAIVLTPQISKLIDNGIVGFNGLIGKDAELFDWSYMSQYRTFGLKLKPEAQVSLKETYVVNVCYNALVNGQRVRLVSQDIKIKLKQGKITSKITGKNTFANKTETTDWTITLENGSKAIVPIQTLELTNYKKDFEIMYNPLENNWKVTYSPKGETKRGKSYTLKMNVYTGEEALDGKVNTISYKVIIK